MPSMITFDRKIFKIVDDVAELFYATASRFNHDDRYGLSSQMQHTAVAMTSAIAESCTAAKSNDALKALEHAHGSLRSLQYQIGLALRLGYIDERRHAVCDRKAVEVNRVLTVHIGALDGAPAK
jgi:four helix bundle protein